MRVDASVDDEGVMRWHYNAGGDDWKQNLPLTQMVPHPMTSIDGGRRRRYIALTGAAPIVAGVGAFCFGFDTFLIAFAAIAGFVVFMFRCGPWIRGPVEWAVFDTMLEDKTIFVFRGSDDDEFDTFVAELDAAIQNAHAHMGEP